REQPEPEEGLERPPWWLWAVSVLLIFWAGFYLGRYGGIFGPYVHVLQREKVKLTEITPKPPDKETKVDGNQVYTGTCAACHQQDGQGIPGAFPPLAGSDWLLKDPETPIRIVLHGLSGLIDVKGTTFNNVMPEWGSRLSNQEIAAILTYARSSWNNSAEEISTEMVEKIRHETSDRTNPWEAEELKKLRSKD
ncbi:MAG: cytochrome c, partial [Deltaproteobacteria bacterium]|nr:cytochrome c [Deltaproteobacteria bacterium]